MKLFTMWFSLMAISIISYSQVIQLKFTAINNGTHVNIDSVLVTNLTHPSDTSIYWPDTTLVLGYVGVPEIDNYCGLAFGIQLSSANPVIDMASFQLSIPQNGSVDLQIFDVSGVVVYKSTKDYIRGKYTFQYSPSHSGVSFITATFDSEVKSLKIIYIGKERAPHKVDCIGYENIKSLPKSVSSSLSFDYTLGDSLSLRGWFNGISTVQYTKTQTSSNYTFGFGMNYPCLGLPQFTYGGQVYHTVQIGAQCWMKENLNIGTMVLSVYDTTSHSNCTNDGVIEKYCYENNPTNCNVYGGLYDWDEMMNYTPLGTQGICPSGWHLPTDAEWCTLATLLDSTVDCNFEGLSGISAGGKLKEIGTTHWISPNIGATNESGFTALGGGQRYKYGNYSGDQWINTYFWSISEGGPHGPWNRTVSSMVSSIGRDGDYVKTSGFSVRCIKN